MFENLNWVSERRTTLPEAIRLTELKFGKKPDYIFHSIKEFNEKIGKVESKSVVLLYEEVKK